TRQARADLMRGLQLRERLGYALPWVAVRARLELARAALALADGAAAQTLLEDIRTILRERPDLGMLGAEVMATAERIRGMPAGPRGASALTGAELRLLPLLTTHLSFSEIGARFAISANTVKTQAKSIYRKLDVGSRSEAVAMAVERGLLEPMPTALA